MDKKEIMKKVGSMQQVAHIRPVTFTEGRSRGMQGFDVKNGQLGFTVLADKCMDIGTFSYKGINMNFLSKPGLQGRNHYDTNGQEALRSIMGGFFFTAGLENICAPFTSGGKDYPMHGRIRTTPAEHVSNDCRFEGDAYVLTVSGEMREAELFGENLVLRRKYETVYGSKTVTMTDEIENESFRSEPLMILYHINMGYPFLDEGTRLYIPTKKVTARDAAAEGHEDLYDVMEAPKDNEPEYVFIHDVKASPDGTVRLAVVNEKLQLGLMIEYTGQYLPYFMEWKSIASGDYVIGLEPANSSVYGRAYHEENDTLHMIGPFKKERSVLKFTVLDGMEEIEEAVREIKTV
ncbi:MAG: aldose 1-epimerase family protein [Lachnospiraceae bacterium]|nr:aldose 1-epimerase family protein [Lachnospiraceae bacterium]